MAGTYGYAPQGQRSRAGRSAEPMFAPAPAPSYGRPTTSTTQQYRQSQVKGRKGSLQYPTTTPYRYNPTGELLAGVGITFAPNFEGFHVVTAIRPNSAAQLSRRILLGDIIHKVNKKPVQGLPTDHVVALLLGTPGTAVELSVLDGTFQYLPPKLVLLQRTPLGIPGMQGVIPQTMQGNTANFSGPGRQQIQGPNRTAPSYGRR